MEFDLISRSALRAQLEAFYKKQGGANLSDDAKAALEAIDNANAVDAEPIVQGCWVDYYMDWKCSRCNTVFKDEIERIKEYNAHDMPKRCPECGAWMKHV